MISRNDHSDFCLFLIEAWAIYWILPIENYSSLTTSSSAILVPFAADVQRVVTLEFVKPLSPER